MEPGQEPWRAIDPVLPGPGRATAPEGGSLPDQRLIAGLVAVAALVIGAIALALLLATPHGGTAVDDGSGIALEVAPIAVSGTRTPGDASGSWLVDVEGAVRSPGLYHLAPGSRVGDAITAAGGYSARVDAVAVATTLNLAAQLQDGAKVVVPERNEGGTPATSSTAPNVGSSASGTHAVDLNTATSAELDTLYGIGPATAAKILASREQQRFLTVEDLLNRKLVRSDVFEKIKDLVMVGG